MTRDVAENPPNDGLVEADLLFENALVYDSAFRRFVPGEVAVRDGRILGVGDDLPSWVSARKRVDCRGRYLIPGLVDIHLHIESSMIGPAAFSRAILAHGVTTCVAEPHEIANVFGPAGVRLFMDLARDCQADIFFGVPSSVPSTEFETTGGEVPPEAVAELMVDPRVRCLGEVMDCRTLIEDPSSRMARTVRAAKAARPDAAIEGHVPGFMGADLQRILFAGVDSDHCEQTPERMLARVEAGMFVEVQEKSLSSELMDFCRERGVWERFCLVTDDVMVDELRSGHLDRVIARAIELGMRPEEAVYVATMTPSVRMGFSDRGRIAPGRLADLVILDDLESFSVAETFKRGVRVDASDAWGIPAAPSFPRSCYQSVHLSTLVPEDFSFEAPAQAREVRCRTIGVQESSTFTVEGSVALPVRDGLVDWASDPAVCLVKVFERHRGTGNVGTGLLAGGCIKRGAVATTWLHDHHNLLVAGRSERDMALAANEVIRAGGGICVVLDGRVLGFLALPVGGILTEAPIDEAGACLAEVRAALVGLGWRNHNPIMSLCTVGLPVSPALKLTDRGLVDVMAGRIVSPFLDA